MAPEELAKKIQRLEDIEAIKNLQNKYQWMLFKQDFDNIPEKCMALTQDDVCMEASDSGIFRGPEGIRRFCSKFLGFVAMTKGAFTMHMASGPVIEVAKDGKTAKGVWFSPGCATDPHGLHALWIWGMYTNDYYREDDGWKIWHLSFIPFFRTPYDEGWVKKPIGTKLSTGLEDEPPSCWNPYDVSKKGPDELFCHLPDAPEPYDTY